MEQDGWDAVLLHVIMDDLSRSRPGAWTEMMTIYGRSPILDELNRLAADGWGYFVTPQDLTQAASKDTGVRARRTGAHGESLELSTRRASLSRSLAAVLRYDVSDWVKVTALQTLLTQRFGSQHSLGQVLLSLLEDRQRFEAVVWEGESWARARYRY